MDLKLSSILRLALSLGILWTGKELLAKEGKNSSLTIQIHATVLPSCRVIEHPPLLTKTHYIARSEKRCNTGIPPQIQETKIPLASVNSNGSVTHIIQAS